MFLIVGLGNPGKQYQQTRHNLGFMVLENLALSWNKRYKKGNGLYESIQKRIGSQNALFAKPTTFMNRSGLAVEQILKKRKTNLSQLLILCDDLNLPLGKLRLREKGSAGGHNGLTSIINTLGTDKFPRMRLGIGYTQEINMEDYVLSPFLSTERMLVKQMIEMGSQGVVDFIRNGINWTMNFYNQ